MPDVSEDMIRAVFAEDGEPDAILIEMTAEGFDPPVRLTNWPGRVPGYPGRFGLFSADEVWDYAPLTFTSGGAGAGEPARAATLEIANSDYRVMEALRQFPGNLQPTLNAYVVRVADPAAAEEEIHGATIDNVSVSAASVKVSFTPKDFDREPACQAAYTPSRVAALF